MLNIFKKIVFVALVALFHVYETWAAYAPTAGIWASSIASACSNCNSYGNDSACQYYCSYKYDTSIYWWGYTTVNSVARNWCFCFSTTNHTGGSCFSGFGTTATNKCYKGMLSANGSPINKAYVSFECISISAITCSQPAWPSSFDGSRLSRGYMSCSTTTGECVATSIATYTCNKGYYDSFGNGTRNYPAAYDVGNVMDCVRCPAVSNAYMTTGVFGTTSGYGASAVTECYQPPQVSGIQNSYGTYTWVSSCFTCGSASLACITSSHCFSQGYTSCTTGGCCANKCNTYVCQTTSATGNYNVSSQCYAHGYGSCVNSCCSNACAGGSSAVCGNGGSAACRTLGYNNYATCTNGCCSGTKCVASYGKRALTLGRCTSDSDCATDTSEYDYSCNTTTGCCERSMAQTSCATMACTTDAQCTANGYNGCNTSTGCCNFKVIAVDEDPCIGYERTTCSKNTQCMRPNANGHTITVTCNLIEGTSAGTCLCTCNDCLAPSNPK